MILKAIALNNDTPKVADGGARERNQEVQGQMGSKDNGAIVEATREHERIMKCWG